MAKHYFFKPRLFATGVVFALIVVGFWFRILYAQRPYFHVDEYESMLAARMVIERGAPIMPSGLLYDPEIAFSYLCGLFILLLGLSYFATRWASVLIGILSIPLAYTTARRMFSSPFAGIIAATFLAIAPEAVIWGARVRRYSMAQFLILLMLWLIWLGTIEADRRRYKMIFCIIYVIAGLTSLLTLMIIPPLLLAVVVLVWPRQLATNWSSINLRKYLIEVTILALISAGMLWWASRGFLTGPAEWFATQQLQKQGVSVLAEAASSLNPFFTPTLSLSAQLPRISEVIAEQPLYLALVVSAFLAILLTFWPKLGDVDKFRCAVRFLLIVVGGVLFEFLFLVSDRWISSRYLFVPLLPALVLLACGPIGRLERLFHSLTRLPEFAHWMFPTLMLAPSLATLAYTGPALLSNLGHRLLDEHHYHQAFQYVAEHRLPDDRVMTIIPPASYWYLGRADYYARGPNPYVFQNNTGEMSDIWTGARWVSTAEDLDEIFRNGQRVWFVIDGTRLQATNSAAFRQQVLARMDVVFETGNVYVLLPTSKPQMIPIKPEVSLSVHLGKQVELTGFALDQEALLARSPAQLTLFWKVLQPLGNYKIFVHLRDHNGQSVAQADHIPSEVLMALPTSTWHVGEIVPDVTYLAIPLEVPPGEYSLFVGMYDPETSARLPVQQDNSGENAALITTLQLP